MMNHWEFMSYHKGIKGWLRGIETAKIMDYGETFNLLIDENTTIPCRLEFNRQWYIVLGQSGIKFNLLKEEVYTIERKHYWEVE